MIEPLPDNCACADLYKQFGGVIVRWSALSIEHAQFSGRESITGLLAVPHPVVPEYPIKMAEFYMHERQTFLEKF